MLDRFIGFDICVCKSETTITSSVTVSVDAGGGVATIWSSGLEKSNDCSDEEGLRLVEEEAVVGGGGAGLNDLEDEG
jgi:hypothetical protein